MSRRAASADGPDDVGCDAADAPGFGPASLVARELYPGARRAALACRVRSAASWLAPGARPWSAGCACAAAVAAALSSGRDRWMTEPVAGAGRSVAGGASLGRSALSNMAAHDAN
jgi:hypothetical protein